mmetsp:Transcript_89512/g.213913  ORF Transcript_89512/g.213913 Transcript_89512/m.213913 type:complete len:200 (+) Transcript_89512:682-1281(+)
MWVDRPLDLHGGSVQLANEDPDHGVGDAAPPKGWGLQVGLEHHLAPRPDVALVHKAQVLWRARHDATGETHHHLRAGVVLHLTVALQGDLLHWSPVLEEGPQCGTPDLHQRARHELLLLPALNGVGLEGSPEGSPLSHKGLILRSLSREHPLQGPLLLRAEGVLQEVRRLLCCSITAVVQELEGPRRQRPREVRRRRAP